ncbi:MAG: tRNA uridine-5-carboxymethylaminomethyl(34) synthesis GTPase MnmE [Traorella sp.]
MLNDTIAAISTALSEGAISIVRVSGDEAIDIVNKCTNKDLSKCDSHTIHYTTICDPITHEILDEVLISMFRAPKTYTREDLVEINCHGGIYITRKILSILLGCGARLANPGEFTQRAFLNGRIDLTQAEAINDMIIANNATNAKMAISGIRGSVKKLLDPLIDSLLDIIAVIEVNIDYPEYDDVEMLTNDKVLPMTQKWLIQIDGILKKSESGQLMKAGIKTAIVGKPNVGKSSLLNALLEEDKAIVSDIAGTTRDLVEGHIQLGNIHLNLIDTAGIHDTSDVIEKIGIDRSKKAIDEAQLIILVLDATQDLDEEDEELLKLTEDKQRIIVYNKSDLVIKEGLSISATQGNIESLIQEIESLYQQDILRIQEPLLNNERQIACLLRAKNSMMNATQALRDGIELDMVTIDLQDAYTALKEILGEVSRDDLLDTLFSNFCLGK